jgi:hypothetical protein
MKIAALERLDLYRDGGSVSASFLGDDGTQYCLFFGIGRRRTAERAPGYASPILKSFTPSEYRGPVTGEVSPTWVNDSRPVTWEEARQILTTLSSCTPGLDSAARRIYEEMVEAAAEDGRSIGT